MKRQTKNFFALPTPDGSGYQISYELGSSRKVHQINKAASATEESPHGAGSFHDLEHHHALMERLANYIEKMRP